MRSVLAAALWAVATLALAHGTSTAYLTLTPSDDGTVRATYRLALRDADALLDLDANGDGALTWGEVEDRAADLRALVETSVVFSADGRRCAAAFDGPAYARDADSGYAAFHARLACGSAVRVHYTLFAGIDPSHRLALQDGAGARLLAPVIAAERRAGAPSEAGADAAARSFFAQGTAHILGGTDHLLFLLALLLPAVVVRDGRRWRAVSDVRSALVQVAWIATAFTLAHSLTLALASFGVVRVPASVIEPLIALTVLLAALNNVWPVVQRRLAPIAFAFGLVHGFGFAEALAPLGLPPGELAFALLAFNLGVEAGQLLVLGATFALLARLRGWTGYPRWVLQGGSAAVALIAVRWMIERTLDVPVF